MALSGKYGQVDIPGVDTLEPVFIIRAQDMLAIGAVNRYLELARHFELPMAVRGPLRQVQLDFEYWQQDNPERVKMPD